MEVDSRWCHNAVNRGSRDIRASPCDALVLADARTARWAGRSSLIPHAVRPAQHFNLMRGINFDSPGPDDIERTRELLERVGYDASAMSDDQALDILRALMTRQPRRETVSLGKACRPRSRPR